MESVLSPQAAQFVRDVDSLSLASLRTRYSFKGLVEFSEVQMHSVGQSMRIYWYETLERAHLAAVTAILRNRRWLAAMTSAATDGNALAFAAAYRGLLESSADTATALANVPPTFAEHYTTIVEALSGKSDTVTVSQQVEDQLIHFSHGRFVQNTEKAITPPSHRAWSVAQYLKVFGETRNPRLASLYQELSDFAHPAKSSVWMWLTQLDERGLNFELSQAQDDSIVSNFLQPSETLLEILMWGFNSSVLVLNTLNYFSIKELHTPALLKWNLDDIPLWVNCKIALTAQGARLHASAA